MAKPQGKQLRLDMKIAKNSNGVNLGFEQKLWMAADKMRNNMDAAEYKQVVLGLIFLKYISDAFKEVYEEECKSVLAELKTKEMVKFNA
jgi:type I restriction-modification system DNA methylase subunit